MKPQRFDIQIWQGDTFEFPFAFEAPDGSVLDLPEVGDGYDEAWMHVRDTISGTLQVKASTGNGRIVLDPYTDEAGIAWSGYVRIPATVTTDLDDWGDGSYELKISDGIKTYTGPFGNAVLVPVNGPEESTP